MFAKHGLRNLVEKLNLDSFLSSNNKSSEEKELLTIPQRLRLSFEELGPTFVKFGQLLASRPDLIPDDYIQEMSLLHDQVQVLDFATIESVLVEEFGAHWRNQFQSVNETPIGAASIAQVHTATLNNGDHVVLKIQRPGIVQKINDDLNVLYFIAELLEKYIPETRSFNPVAMVDEYFKTLELETNFVVEANNIRRMKENFKDDTGMVIPKVYFEMTTERVLVMEELKGKPLSKVESLQAMGINPDDVIKKGLKAYLKMVFIDGFFHGDLHAGNFFIMPNDKIGLIDFGVVGRLNSKTQSAIVNMLLALSKEDYTRLAYEYVDLAPFSEDVNVDLFAKDLQAVIAPYYGLTLKHVNAGKILMASAGIAASQGLVVPTELMLFFKSIISIEGLGSRISKDFDFLAFTLSQVGEVAQSFFQPVKMANEASLLFRESKTFLTALPRQLNLLFRKMNSPDYHTKIQIDGLGNMQQTISNSFHLLFLGVIISSLILASSLIYALSGSIPNLWMVAGFPGFSVVGFILAGVTSLIAFYNYLMRD
ncbi:ubiquinone biosynthesis protein [Bdellovibrio sp. qaytius]|nr:ubiquinone biosynthesis protein [Bdellovibrio sp. qaytius]